MSELLDLANKLVEAREKSPKGKWEDTGYIIAAGDAKSIFHDQSRLDETSKFIVLAGNHAVDIIKGYQDLVKRMSIIIHACAMTIYSNSIQSHQDIIDATNAIWKEANESIPEGIDGEIYE